MKEVMKYFDIKIFLISIAVPIALNGVNIICVLFFFSGYRGFPVKLVDSIINVVYYLANWPILLSKYALIHSQNCEIDLNLLSAFEFKNIAINVLGWGLIGLLSSFVIKKYRKQSSQSPS